jgi:hypothetical protein
VYTPNNIKFRIISSTSLAQFKHDQAFDFNELINNDAYSFSSESRETLLLNYEVWFKFICLLEKIFIKSVHTDDTISTLASTIHYVAIDTIAELSTVIKQHPEIFRKHSSPHGIINTAHTAFVNEVLRVIDGCGDDTMYIAFPKIVSAISSSLHNLLFILHEVEKLNNKKGHYFLSLTDEILALTKNSKSNPLVDRAVMYQDTFGVSKFVLKNYTNSELSKGFFEQMDEAGITITPQV